VRTLEIEPSEVCWHQNPAHLCIDVIDVSQVIHKNDFRRFLGVSAVEMPQWAPFGDGGRNCVGMKLAVEEAKVRGQHAIPCDQPRA